MPLHVPGVSEILGLHLATKTCPYAASLIVYGTRRLPSWAKGLKLSSMSCSICLEEVDEVLSSRSYGTLCHACVRFLVSVAAAAAAASSALNVIGARHVL